MELEKRAKIPKREVGDDGDEYCPSLLEDILFEEILPRLPVQSLIRFKRVSKKWLHYITKDSSFIYNHLRRQSQTAKLSIFLPPNCEKMYLFDSRSNWARVRNVSLIANKVCGIFGLHYIIGSCNGLVCVYHSLGKWLSHPLVAHKDEQLAIMLWNPETGEARDILVPPLPYWFCQRPGDPNRRRQCQDYPVYGFGYDEYRDDYKVARVVPTQPTLLNFDVFSLNSGDWRRLDKGFYGYTVCEESSEPVLLKGCLYWLVLKVDESISSVWRRCILSFDLRDEEFRVIDVLEHVTYFNAGLFRHRLVKWKQNCLAYLSFPYEQTGHDFDFRLEIILDSKGNVVIDSLNASTARGFAWSSEPPSSLMEAHLIERKWRFCGVSHGRLFVEERGRRRYDQMSKLVAYDSVGSAYENTCCQVLMSIACVWNGRSNCVHDFVPSLVSVYPDRKMMMEAKRKMEATYWVDVFWKMVRLNKQQFGLGRLPI